MTPNLYYCKVVCAILDGPNEQNRLAKIPPDAACKTGFRYLWVLQVFVGAELFLQLEDVR